MRWKFIILGWSQYSKYANFAYNTTPSKWADYSNAHFSKQRHIEGPYTNEATEVIKQKKYLSYEEYHIYKRESVRGLRI